jgi:ADP-ribose pyrophosphatase
MQPEKQSYKKAQVHKANKLYKGRVFSFVAEDVTLPNDSRTEMAFVHHPGSTAIVPLLDDNTVIMERQYRHPVRDYLFEIPAGTMDPGETWLECAGRELEEETGYVAEEFIELGKVHILPAYSDELIYVYLARGLTRSEQNLDQDEIINVVEYPLDQALQMIAAGRITDALTILALQWAWFNLNGRNQMDTN